MQTDKQQTVMIRPIDASAFEPFGYVLPPSPDGQRHNHPGLIENRRPGKAAINLAQICADDYSGRDHFILSSMERHAYSTQSFFPQDVGHYLVIVGKNGSDDRPLVETLLAFSVPGDVGITYKANTWHTGIAVLDGGRRFLMIVHEDGTADDCEFTDIQPTRINLRG